MPPQDIEIVEIPDDRTVVVYIRADAPGITTIPDSPEYALMLLFEAATDRGVDSVQATEGIGRDRISDYMTLKKRVTAWNREANHRSRTINWSFTSSNARDKFGYIR